MSWTGLEDIGNVAPLGETDRRVLDEVRAVLERHGALQRFGVGLLHSHFPLADDELLVETIDGEARTLTIRPMRAEEVRDKELVPTAWRLDGPDHAPICVTYCHPGYFHATGKSQAGSFRERLEGSEGVEAITAYFAAYRATLDAGASEREAPDVTAFLRERGLAPESGTLSVRFTEDERGVVPFKPVPDCPGGWCVPERCPDGTPRCGWVCHCP